MNLKELVAKLSLEEKASLLSGQNNWETKTVERLNIPSIFLSDGPHGVRKQMGAADHLGLNPSEPATCFPTAAAIANSWDEELGEEVGRALGAEAAAQGVNVLLGPGLNIKRNPLCARNFEYFSEDPYLSGKLAAAYIRGIQSKGVSACPKHFAANSQDHLRMHSDSVVDERTLREIYLTGFEIAVKEGYPKSLMTSYNKVNGVYANENPKLLRDILVDEWGFDGFVVSDWGGSNDHVSGVDAGSHLEMPAPGPYSDREVVAAVRDGRLSADVLDERVEELLRVIFDLQIANAPPVDYDAQHDIARKAAEGSIVMLKNEGDILPLKQGTSVAVIGDFARTPRYQGAGSSQVNTTKLDNAYDALKQSELDVAGFAAGFLRNGGQDAGLLAEAVDLAKQAQVVLLFVGLSEISEAEGLDRTHMRIAQNQIDLINAVYMASSNVVAVLSCGAVVEMPWIDKCKAVVHGFLGGQAGADAVVNVLTGKVNPSGKLAESYPVTYEDVPNYRYYPGMERTAEYREGLYVGYRYYEKAGIPVRFPFGFGLSYTTFTYSDLTVGEKDVTFTVTNSGSVAGAEITQLYIAKPDNTLFCPAQELKGFAKVFLEAGESKTVVIPLDDKAFRYFNVKTGRFETAGGRYEVRIGASSADVRLTGTDTIEGTVASNPYAGMALPSYEGGQVTNVSDAEFETLLGHSIPPPQWDRTKLLERNDTLSQMRYAKSPVARLAYRILNHTMKKAEAKGVPDLNILFIFNMPFRGIAKMTVGAVDMNMADAILFMVNGHFLRGLGRLIGAWRRNGKR